MSRLACDTASVNARAHAWIVSGDTGLSSRAIWGVMMGVRVRGEYPWDPDDFGRCYRLLATIPDWRARLSEVAAAHPHGAWPALVDAWDELTALYEEEVGTGADRDAHFGKRAPRLYARMGALRGDR